MIHLSLKDKTIYGYFIQEENIYTTKNKKNGLQFAINGVHICEIITILVMAGKKRTTVISKNKCHVSYIGGLKDSHLLTQLTRGHLT